jgi:hypothetical protein
MSRNVEIQARVDSLAARLEIRDEALVEAADLELLARRPAR